MRVCGWRILGLLSPRWLRCWFVTEPDRCDDDDDDGGAADAAQWSVRRRVCGGAGTPLQKGQRPAAGSPDVRVDPD